MKIISVLLIAIATLASACSTVRVCKSPFPDACRNAGPQIGGDGAGDGGNDQ